MLPLSGGCTTGLGWEVALDSCIRLVETGDYAAAETGLLRVLGEAEESGAGDERLAQVLSWLGTVYKHQGRSFESQRCLQRALSLAEKRYGTNHPELFNHLNNLAVAHHDLGNYGKAESLYRRSLDSAMEAGTAQVAMTLNNLAMLYSYKGNYTEAEILHRRALDTWEKTLGPLHPQTTVAWYSLGVLHRTRGDNAQARLRFEQALTTWEDTLGPQHMQLAGVLAYLADLDLAEEKYHDAENRILRALTIGEKLLGPAHPHVGRMMNLYASVLHKTGRKAEAKKLKNRAKALLARHASDNFTKHTVDFRSLAPSHARTGN
jgi:tetratricopeptide (TPR) repeat protein